MGVTVATIALPSPGGRNVAPASRHARPIRQQLRRVDFSQLIYPGVGWVCDCCGCVKATACCMTAAGHTSSYICTRMHVAHGLGCVVTGARCEMQPPCFMVGPWGLATTMALTFVSTAHSVYHWLATVTATMIPSSPRLASRRWLRRFDLV
jgi:hypothetical protein